MDPSGYRFEGLWALMAAALVAAVVLGVCVGLLIGDIW